MTSGSRLVTVGETLVALTPPAVGPLRLATSLGVSIAGAEANVAIAVRRLGAEASWIGRVGADELGELILTRLGGGRRRVERDPRPRSADEPAPQGAPDRRRRPRRLLPTLRAGVEARPLGPRRGRDPRRPGVLHVTGITPALSASARACVRAAVEIARAAGVPVSLDFNHRTALWTAEDAAAELRDLTRLADVVFAGEAEAGLVVDEDGPAAQAAALARLGPRQVVITRGPEGAAALIDGVPTTVAAHPVRVLDPVGAGDAFVGGYLAELLAGADASARLATAARCGAFAVTVAGDWEGLPSRAELGLLDAGARDVVR